jgi:hypothetical protein
MVEITRVDKSLPMTERIDQLNDQTMGLSGKNEKASFDVNELDSLFSGSGLSRQYVRNFSYSHNTGSSAWYNWTNLRSETGYDIWKFDASYGYKPNSNNELYIDDKVIAYKGTATAEDITSFESVFTYDGASFTDQTTEAGTEAGTAFTCLSDTDGYIYVGSDATFTGIRMLLDIKGSNYILDFEYSNSGGGWSQLLTTEHSLIDGTSNLRRDAAITFSAPGDWATLLVNSATRYWIRISTTQDPVTEATMYAALPYNSVPTLLALSSQDVKNETWAFCDLNNVIYVTFRNTGNSSYEGNRFIQSSSSTANKQNFFRFNHTIQGNFENTNYNYTGSGIAIMRADGSAPLSLTESTGGPLIDMVGTSSPSKTGAGVFIPISFNGSTYYIRLFN